MNAAWRAYWGPLADEPLWLKLLAWAIKPGILLAAFGLVAWSLWANG